MFLIIERRAISQAEDETDGVLDWVVCLSQCPFKAPLVVTVQNKTVIQSNCTQMRAFTEILYEA